MGTRGMGAFFAWGSVSRRKRSGLPRRFAPRNDSAMLSERHCPFGAAFFIGSRTGNARPYGLQGAEARCRAGACSRQSAQRKKAARAGGFSAPPGRNIFRGEEKEMKKPVSFSPFREPRAGRVPLRQGPPSRPAQAMEKDAVRIPLCPGKNNGKITKKPVFSGFFDSLDTLYGVGRPPGARLCAICALHDREGRISSAFRVPRPYCTPLHRLGKSAILMI